MGGRGFDAEKALGWFFLLAGLGMDVGFALLGKPGAYGTVFYLFAFLIYARKRDEEVAAAREAGK